MRVLSSRTTAAERRELGLPRRWSTVWLAIGVVGVVNLVSTVLTLAML